MSASSSPTGNHHTRIATTAVISAQPFQRIFTSEDEIQLLESFSKLANPGKISAAKVKHLKKSMGQRFSETQLTGKLRKLRQRYVKMGKPRLRSHRPFGYNEVAHELSWNIWGHKYDDEERMSVEVGSHDDDDDDDDDDDVGMRDISDVDGPSPSAEMEEAEPRDVESENESRDGLEIDGGRGLKRKVSVLEVDGSEDVEMEIGMESRDGLELSNVEIEGGGGAMGGMNDKENVDNGNGLEVENVDGEGMNGKWRIARREVDVPPNMSFSSPVTRYQRAKHTTTPVVVTPTVAGSPGSRRVFREEDEIHLLKWFSKFAKSSNPSKITSSSVQRFRKSLGPKFSDTQLSDKLRKLKQKYHRMAKSKSKILSAHDREIYELSRTIWGKNENPRDDDTDADNEESAQDNHEVDGQDDGDHAGINNQNGFRGLNASDMDIPSVETEVAVLEKDGENGETDNGGALGELNGSEVDGHGGSRMRASVPELDGMDEVRRLGNAEMENGRHGMNDNDNLNNEEELGARNVNGNSKVDGGGINENFRSDIAIGGSTVRSEVDVNKYPFLLKEFSRCLPDNPVWKEGFKEMSEEKLKNWNEKWKKLQIEEARIMAERAGMLQEQMKELLKFAKFYV